MKKKGLVFTSLLMALLGSVVNAQAQTCAPTAVTPYIYANGNWSITAAATINGSQLILGPQPTQGGAWSWNGCGTSGSAREQYIMPSANCVATAVYTNDCGAQTTQAFTIGIPMGTGPHSWAVNGNATDSSSTVNMQLTLNQGGAAAAYTFANPVNWSADTLKVVLNFDQAFVSNRNGGMADLFQFYSYNADWSAAEFKCATANKELVAGRDTEFTCSAFSIPNAAAVGILFAGTAGSVTIKSAVIEDVQGTFNWTSSPPLISSQATSDAAVYGVKDPSIVYANGKYHVFMTLAGTNGWGLGYTSFEKWSDAPAAKIVPLDQSPMGPGYRAAPQVFYFAPQNLWYLIYQGGDPLYSTSTDISNPLSWTAPKPLFPVIPDIIKDPQGKGWLDFWVICDDKKCYMFATDDNGRFLRSETELSQFPNGFHNTVAVMTEAKAADLFEASNTYKVANTNTYITMVEASSPQGRYFRIWKSTGLEGTWEPFSSAPMNTFANGANVEQIWSEGISHGELVRNGFDQTMTIDPCKPLEFLFQGFDVKAPPAPTYQTIPYQLGVITANGENPISVLCR